MGFPPVLYCFDSMLLALENPTKFQEESLSSQPMFPLKHFDNFPPLDWVGALKV